MRSSSGRRRARRWSGRWVVALSRRKVAASAAEFGVETPPPPRAATELAGTSRDRAGKEGTMLRAGEEYTEDREQRLHERTHARVQAIRAFYVHGVAFLVVNAALFALNTLAGGVWWFYWPLIGWGIGLGLHALAGCGSGGGG